MSCFSIHLRLIYGMLVAFLLKCYWESLCFPAKTWCTNWILWLTFSALHRLSPFQKLVTLASFILKNLFEKWVVSCKWEFWNLEIFWQIRNEKARRYLSSMRKKQPVPFSHNFLKADPLALRLLERLLAFDPKDRASAEDVREEFFFITQIETLMFIVSDFFLFTGTVWSILQWFVELRAWTINAANFKAWVWFWEKEVKQRWCQRINLPRGKHKNPSSTSLVMFINHFTDFNNHLSLGGSTLDIGVSSSDVGGIQARWWSA